MANKRALLKLAAKLRRLRHEKHYKQNVWAIKTACGTTACLAGHAVLLNGYRPAFAKNRNGRPYEDTGLCVRVGTKPRAVARYREEIRYRARRILGLTCDEADALFSSSPNIDWPAPFDDRIGMALYAWPLNIESAERPSRVAADLLEAIAKGEVVL